MSHSPIPAVVSLGDSSSWTSVSEETVASLHVRSVIGIDASAALVVRRELVDGHGHTHGRVVDFVLACGDPAQAEHLLRAVERYSGSPLLTAAAMRIIGPERFAEQIFVAARTLRAAAIAENQIAADLAKRSAELDRTIVVRKAGGTAQPRVELRRGGSTDAFWSIAFGEDWERDRFLDWFKWQDHRLHEFAAHLDANDPAFLRSLLLREMIETEQLARRNKLATSGRRPLRLWCGKAE